jgi:hypothetical protein
VYFWTPLNAQGMSRFYLTIILASFTALSAFSQKNIKANTEVLELKETKFDFGKIPQGKPVMHNFEVINRGKSPVIIENVEASCGCTTPEWSNTPIPSGEKSIIKVGFNASNEGHFTKSITINYNNDQIKTLLISGEVYPSPTTSAPLNSSLSLIKQ